MRNKSIIAPESCTGCGLCANVCSQNAIHMAWTKDGFLAPEVDTDACTNCGLCVKQCIALEPTQSYSDDIASVTSYAGWNRSEKIHIESSSGGVFTALANHIIQQGGVVYGVVWQNKQTAAFDKAETEQELARMRGSKYTPALPGQVYKNVLASLKQKRPVLFSGTPCQVHALYKYLRKPYENLLTIDIVCHGVPSHLILEKYIAENEERSKKEIEYISFRDKPEGWQRYHVTKHYKDGSSESESLDKDIYMQIFLCDKALNKACYNCPYAHIPRQGDITLGDYWGVENHHANWPLDKGISAILANTDKGKNALSSINSELELIAEPFDKIYQGQGIVYIRPPKQIPGNRSIVLKKLTRWPLRKVHPLAVDYVKIGSIYMSRTSIIFKVLRFMYRTAKFMKPR